MRRLIVSLVLSCVACGGDDTARASAVADDPRAAAAVAQDTALRAASEALAQGRAWEATRLLAPVLRDSARRTPNAVLLAATAAAEWGGWDEVERLLAGAPWVDSLFGGSGRTLLARAALSRGADTAALEHASRAVATARADEERGLRLVLLARALDRLDRLDSARAAYADAAKLLPPAADWLRLRAAGVTADSARRAADYAVIAVPVARERAPWTEALARERTHDLPGAIRAYEAVGARPTALRLRLAAAGADTAARDSVRRELVQLIAARSGTADARTATEVLDASFPELAPADELVVARSAAASGPLPRAATAFARALGAGQGTARDRFAYGTVLYRLNRDREAAAQFARIAPPAAPADLVAGAQYQRARALLAAGEGAEAVRTLRQLLRRFPRDTGAAGSALFLLGDLATDEQRDGPARSAFRDLAQRYPTHPLAASARFRAAIIAMAAGDRRTAAVELDSLLRRYPRTDELNAAQYWAGRAWASLGDTAKARERWRAIIGREPLSYYSALAARRLGEEPWAPPAAPDSFARVPAVDSAIARAALLERLGMDFEARLEYDRLAADAHASPERLLATADAFRNRQQSTRAIALGWRALGRATHDARVYRLIYPVVHRDVLVAEARARGLDPALVAALIRQESSFNPRATSAPGARGLMQLMPATGRQIARALGYPVWDPVLLYEPDVNVQLGTVHLANLARQYDDLVRLLAAYNAGGSRVTRWARKTGADDPEMFAERISFVETRDYVRIVQRNRDLYRALYGW